jgi:hypothetical protein
MERRFVLDQRVRVMVTVAGAAAGASAVIVQRLQQDLYQVRFDSGAVAPDVVTVASHDLRPVEEDDG